MLNDANVNILSLSPFSHLLPYPISLAYSSQKPHHVMSPLIFHFLFPCSLSCFFLLHVIFAYHAYISYCSVIPVFFDCYHFNTSSATKHPKNKNRTAAKRINQNFQVSIDELESFSPRVPRAFVLIKGDKLALYSDTRQI